ncbi:DedA family protein [Primorskyibacter sp. 2E233]|uniref:DedA family protein n=1 Tax=Primorskyibacter sp. 2E233 TaxID=3413431 RepID=UPI003BF26453
MTDAFLALVPLYGGWILMAVTFLSCLALPVPSSFMMLAGGAFAASGDLNLLTATLSAFAGAVVGDQTGYLIGNKGGTPLVSRLQRRPKTADTVQRASRLLEQRGGIAVFLTRWLLSPLGPYVNLIGGAMGLGWQRFTFGSVSGEALWVSIYTGLGFVFAGQIAEVAQIASDLAGLLAAATVTIMLGTFLFRHRHDHSTKNTAKGTTYSQPESKPNKQ